MRQPRSVRAFLKVFLLTAALCIGGVAALGHVSRSSVTTLQQDPRLGFELRLDYSYLLVADPCGLVMPPRYVHESNWIYSQETNGVVAADKLMLTYKRGRTEFKQEALRGSIAFTNGQVRVQLQTPIFANGDTPSGYEPYRLNGNYKIAVR